MSQNHVAKPGRKVGRGTGRRKIPAAATEPARSGVCLAGTAERTAADRQENHGMTLSKSRTFGAALIAASLALTAGAAMADRKSGMGPMGDIDGMGGMGPMAGFDFAAMDADTDGKLTPAEIEAWRTARLTAADTDGDGKLSPAELTAMGLSQMQAQMQARAEDRAARMIDRLDADKDGALAIDEMASRAMPAQMFTRLDADGDGALSEAEIAAAKDRMADRMGGKRGDKRGSGMRDGSGKGGQGGQGGHGRGHGQGGRGGNN
jgi:hypothetical protein